MSITKLPSGKYRAQVYDPRVGHNVSVSRVLGPPGTFPSKREAKAARERARERIALVATASVTVKAWWERWTTDPLFARPKESTNLHNRERTRVFADRFGALPMTAVDDSTVSLWLSGGNRNGTVPALRAMFNDARSAKGGRLIHDNPFAGLKIDRGPGNRHKAPPSEQLVWTLIQHAKTLTFPAFAAWLQVAAFTGIRPGELDALRWENVHLDTSRIDVLEQWNARSRGFTLPKNGLTRQAPITAPARDALVQLPQDGDFVFTNLYGRHLTPGSRAYHWNAVRAASGWTESLYLATRHFAGWWMVNVLDLPSEDVAIALGHTDGGELVRLLYGHRDKDRALDRAIQAAAAAGTVKPLHVIREDTA